MVLCFVLWCGFWCCVVVFCVMYVMLCCINSASLHYTNTIQYTTQHCTTLHYRILHYTTLHYTTLHYTTLHYTSLHYTTLHYTTLHYTTLQMQHYKHYTTLHYKQYTKILNYATKKNPLPRKTRGTQYVRTLMGSTSLAPHPIPDIPSSTRIGRNIPRAK